MAVEAVTRIRELVAKKEGDFDFSEICDTLNRDGYRLSDIEVWDHFYTLLKGGEIKISRPDGGGSGQPNHCAFKAAH